eukprot:4522488-Amphidinium_carterae.1
MPSIAVNRALTAVKGTTLRLSPPDAYFTTKDTPVKFMLTDLPIKRIAPGQKLGSLMTILTVSNSFGPCTTLVECSALSSLLLVLIGGRRPSCLRIADRCCWNFCGETQMLWFFSCASVSSILNVIAAGIAA